MNDSLLVNSRKDKVGFEVTSEVIVDGRNPELSDMDNPEGFIYKVVYFVIGIYPDGYRLRHNKNFDTQERAEAFCKRIYDANFFNLRYWDYHHPVYGSEAYMVEEKYGNLPAEL